MPDSVINISPEISFNFHSKYDFSHFIDTDTESKLLDGGGWAFDSLFLGP